jgi:transposase InsO family protein
VDKDLELRDRIQGIALEWSVYGYRRIWAELRRQGIIVNHKRVLRVMREDNLLCLRKKSFIKTLKMEEVYLYEYDNKEEAYSRIGEFI